MKHKEKAGSHILKLHRGWYSARHRTGKVFKIHGRMLTSILYYSNLSSTQGKIDYLKLYSDWRKKLRSKGLN